jgi:hypothetical protein
MRHIADFTDPRDLLRPYRQGMVERRLQQGDRLWPERPTAARRLGLAAALSEHRTAARNPSLERQASDSASALTQLLSQ